MRRLVKTQSSWLHQGALASLLLAYLAISLTNLSVIPPLYEDEAWQASTGWKLARQGVFGSDMFAGLHGMERRYYGFMPLHPMLQALVFRSAGLGLLQVRIISVLMGLLTLVLAYALGRRLFGQGVGLLSVALLLLLRVTGTTRSQLSGILLLDMARLGRYDILVPVFGLAALHTYLSAARRQHSGIYLLAGLLAGLAGLSHVYGAFWLVVLAMLALWERAGWRALLAIVAGCLAPWLLYLAYVLAGLADWVGQTRIYAPRFDLLNPRWYLNNLLLEPRRYGPGLGPPGWHYLLRPGFWCALLALPAALLALAWRAVGRHDRAARAIVVPALILPALFALLITLKLVNYTITILPVGCVAAAWGSLALWQQAAGTRHARWLRGALLAALLALGAEGSVRIARLHSAAATTTPHAEYMARVRTYVPAGARVLGMQHDWLGLHDTDYRSWLVPFFQADASDQPPARAMEQALEAIAPDVILINARLRAYFNSAPSADPKPQAVQRWMRRQGYVLIASVMDQTYGTMEIFQRRVVSGHPAEQQRRDPEAHAPHSR